MRPLAIDLFAGLFGWSEGLTQEGWRTIGFDLEDMHAKFGLQRPLHCQLTNDQQQLASPKDGQRDDRQDTAAAQSAYCAHVQRREI